MADWSSVALAGVTAAAGVLGGGIGYLGARLQARVGLRQVEIEIDRLNAEHAEDHLRNRQSTYHNFLDVEQRYLAMMSREDFPRGLYDDWLADYHHTYDGVILFGTDHAREAAERLNETHKEIHRDYYREVNGTFSARILRAYFAHQEDYRAGRQEMLDAMREDVAPRVRPAVGRLD